MDYSQYKQLEFRRKFWKIFGAQITMFNSDSDQVLGIIKMKAWKLREDIRLFSDEAGQQEVIRIAARNIIDIGATYDIYDSATSTVLYTLRRKGLKSIFVRDHWYILDVGGNQIGDVVETSSVLALVRRWLGLFGEIPALIFAFVPEKYDITYGSDGQHTLGGRIIHRKNPFIVKMGLDTRMAEAKADARLPIAIVSLLSVIDAAKG